jgi:hypothetical protein
MRKELIIGLLVLIFLAGCGNLGSRSEPVDVHKGTVGISAEFLDNAPPRELLEGAHFTATVEVENKGSAHVDDGYLSLSTEDAFVINDGDAIKNFALEAKTIDIPIGEKEIYTYSLQAKSLGPQTEIAETNIQLSVCNDYTTEAETSICVDTDIFDQDIREKACNVRTVGLSGGQGAPVAVTKITPNYSPGERADTIRASFTVDVRNTGNGRTYAQGSSFEACTPQGVNSWNSATLRAWLGDVQLSCSNGDLNLEKGSASILCNVPQGISSSAGTYSTTMRVEINYGYTFTETARVRIKQTS